MDYKKIAELISKSKKKTQAKVYLQGNLERKNFEGENFQAFGEGSFWILIGDFPPIEKWMKKNKHRIQDYFTEITARYSALPLLDLTQVEARVEPGAVIRKGAKIGKDCIVMMGAVINIGAEVGERTMVDMNAVVGARAAIGKDCHVGAGAVIAGVLEPPSRKPVKIGDNVLIGANSVVLEGIQVGQGSVIAAGAVVLEDVPPGIIVAGVPAKKMKEVKDLPRKDKISIIKSLRELK